MNTGKISLGKLLSLLIFVAGVQSALADVWDGTTRTKANETTIDGKKYYLIESAANLAWFSDSVNIYVSKEQAKRFSADSLAPATMTSSDTAKAEAYADKVKKNFLDTASTDDLKKDSTKIWNKAKNDSLKVVADSIKEAKAEIIAANVDAFFKSFGNNYDAITAIAEKTEKKSKLWGSNGVQHGSCGNRFQISVPIFHRQDSRQTDRLCQIVSHLFRVRFRLV